MFDVITSTATIVSPQVNTAINHILGSLLELILAGLGTIAIAALQSFRKSQQSWWKKAIAERAVKFVQQRYFENDEKQKEASKLISQHFPRISEQEVAHLMEEAVVNMKMQIANPPPPASPTPTVQEKPL